MLHGHDHAIDALIAAARSGRLHHAWLLAGPQGIGKATFADLAAKWLLATAAEPALLDGNFALPPDHRTAHLIDSGQATHPDFMRLERLEREKTGDRARNISVDQVRGLSRLFATGGTFSERRVVVIDAADDMEREAANALLKNLEEPPAGALFLLVSHAPGRLLPTIRSRCRTVRFAPLDETAMAAVLAQAAPELPATERMALIAAGEGAPGRALTFAGLDVSGLDGVVDRLIAEGDPTNKARVALARSLALKAAQPRYALFLQRLPQRIAAHAKSLHGEAMARAIDAWARARDLAAAAPRLSLDPQATVFELAGIAASLAPEGIAAKR